ncbi:MAG TPA: tol-pal system protein YbgF [Gammaproteobacteria bacterium]|nr:tol-pal system protein YbgF [Gammaproteobacteria bacterium]
MAFTALRATPPLLAGVLLFSLGAVAWSEPRDEELTLDERVARLEQQTRNQSLAELFSRLDSLQREVQRLQGKIEEQGHLIEQLPHNQKEPQQALERRIEALEQRSSAPTPPPVGAETPPPATDAPPASTLHTPDSAESPELQPAATDAGNEAAAYQQAFDLLKKGSYEKAITAFRDFLKRYPNGANAGNAQYWLGETYYVTRKFKEAQQAFQTLLDRYPNSPKQPDASLKIGFVHYEQGEWAKARKTLGEVASRYPGTAAAKLAQARLDKMQKEGH